MEGIVRKLQEHCKIFEYFYEEENAIVIMEYCEDGDLETLMKKRKMEGERFSEQEILQMATEVLSGLEMMHNKKIIHRDIKPANILISFSFIVHRKWSI